MKKYTIDFTNVKNYIDFYDVISDSFNFPSWFGRNPDAIWDLLTGYIETPAEINVINADVLNDDVTYDYRYFYVILQELSVEHSDEFKVKFVNSSEPTKTYIFDFSNVKTMSDFKNIIDNNIENIILKYTPDNYKELFGAISRNIEYPADIHIRGVNKLPTELKKTYEVFHEALIKTVEPLWPHIYNRYKITYED